MLSKLTILEMLEQVQLDRDELLADATYLDQVEGDFRNITRPVDLIVYWLERELGSKANG